MIVAIELYRAVFIFHHLELIFLDVAPLINKPCLNHLSTALNKTFQYYPFIIKKNGASFLDFITVLDFYLWLFDDIVHPFVVALEMHGFVL